MVPVSRYPILVHTSERATTTRKGKSFLLLFLVKFCMLVVFAQDSKTGFNILLMSRIERNYWLVLVLHI